MRGDILMQTGKCQRTIMEIAFGHKGGLSITRFCPEYHSRRLLPIQPLHISNLSETERKTVSHLTLTRMTGCSYLLGVSSIRRSTRHTWALLLPSPTQDILDLTHQPLLYLTSSYLLTLCTPCESRVSVTLHFLRFVTSAPAWRLRSYAQAPL